MTQPISDDALVLAFLNGDRSTFEAIVERHSRFVFAIAYAHLGDPESAEDLTQEVFLRALLSLEKMAPPYHLTSWLRTVTRNLAKNWRRNLQRRSRLVAMVPLSEAHGSIADPKSEGRHDLMSQQEEAEAVRRAVNQLPLKLREVTLLHFAEGMSQTEIAERLGIHQATVSRLLRRSLRLMRGMLENTLRETASTMRMPGRVATRTTLVTAAALSLSSAARASLLAAAGGQAVAASSSVGALAGVLKLVATGKGLTATAAVALVVTLGAIGLMKRDGHSPRSTSIDSQQSTVAQSAIFTSPENANRTSDAGEERGTANPRPRGGTPIRTDITVEHGELPSISSDARPASTPISSLIGEQISEQLAEFEPGPGVISGRILGALSGEPVGNVEVTLGRHEHSQLGNMVTFVPLLTALTDIHGEFRFEGLPLEELVVTGREQITTHVSRTNSERITLTTRHPEDDITLFAIERMPVAGVVVDAQTGEPVPNFEMRAYRANHFGRNWEECVTDATGHFQIAGIYTSGDHAMFGRANGRFSLRFVFTDQLWVNAEDGENHAYANIDDPNEALDLRLEVIQGQPLFITAIDPTGNPVSRVTLDLITHDGESFHLGNTDDEGLCRAVYPGALNQPFHIMGVTYGNPTQHWPLFLSEEIQPGDFSVLLEASLPVDLDVQVLGADGDPITGMAVTPVPLLTVPHDEGCRLSLRYEDWLMPVTTDADGWAHLEGLAPVPHRVVVHSDPSEHRFILNTPPPNYPFAMAGVFEDIDLTEAPSPTEMVIQLDEITLRGTTVAAGAHPHWNQPIEGASIIWGAERDANILPQVWTDIDGHFEITGRSNEFQSGLVVDAPGYAETHLLTSQLSTGEENTITLFPQTIFSGNVIRPDGLPVPPSPIVLWQPEQHNRTTPWAFTTMTWDLDGYTRLDGSFRWVPEHFIRQSDVRPFDVLLMVFTENHEIGFGAATVADLPSEEIDVGVIMVEPGHPLTGQVLDIYRQPVAGAEIGLQNADNMESAAIYAGGRPSSTVVPELWMRWTDETDEEGHFELNDLPPGRWALRIRVPGFHDQWYPISLPEESEISVILEELEPRPTR